MVEQFRSGQVDIAPMADDLRADLDELLLQTRQRPILDRLRRRQSAQEIAEIIGQRGREPGTSRADPR